MFSKENLMDTSLHWLTPIFFCVWANFQPAPLQILVAKRDHNRKRETLSRRGRPTTRLEHGSHNQLEIVLMAMRFVSFWAVRQHGPRKITELSCVVKDISKNKLAGEMGQSRELVHTRGRPLRSPRENQRETATVSRWSPSTTLGFT